MRRGRPKSRVRRQWRQRRRRRRWRWRWRPRRGHGHGSLRRGATHRCAAAYHYMKSAKSPYIPTQVWGITIWHIVYDECGRRPNRPSARRAACTSFLCQSGLCTCQKRPLHVSEEASSLCQKRPTSKAARVLHAMCLMCHIP